MPPQHVAATLLGLLLLLLRGCCCCVGGAAVALPRQTIVAHAAIAHNLQVVDGHVAAAAVALF